MQYDPKKYWSELHRRDDLTAVGQSGLPLSMNVWLYRAISRTLAARVRDWGLQPRTVFEIGAGTGHWVSWWLSRGASVDGCDIDPHAVSRLQERFPGAFSVADISRDRPRGSYDLVFISNVLLHVTDEARFRQALRHAADLVGPGGRLLMVEPLQTGTRYRHTYPPGASSKARPAERYLQPLVAAGLRVATVESATAVCSDPVEASSRRAFAVLMGAWRLSKGPAILWHPLGAITGRVLYTLDRFALRAGLDVSTKLVVLERPA